MISSGARGVRLLRHRIWDPLVDRPSMVDLVVANGENAAAGFGLTAEVARELLALVSQVITSGNHIWDKKESRHSCPTGGLLRPGQLSRGRSRSGFAGFLRPRRVAGRGDQSGGAGLHGQSRLPLSCCRSPGGRAAASNPIILVDFHAEATSEKSPLAIISPGAFRRLSAPTPMCRRLMSVFSPGALRLSPMSA
jgi:2',3'-cyclic-nucleotide 2'-phosphodiesterase